MTSHLLQNPFRPKQQFVASSNIGINEQFGPYSGWQLYFSEIGTEFNINALMFTCTCTYNRVYYFYYFKRRIQR